MKKHLFQISYSCYCHFYPLHIAVLVLGLYVAVWIIAWLIVFYVLCFILLLYGDYALCPIINIENRCCSCPLNIDNTENSKLRQGKVLKVGIVPDISIVIFEIIAYLSYSIFVDIQNAVVMGDLQRRVLLILVKV